MGSVTLKSSIATHATVNDPAVVKDASNGLYSRTGGAGDVRSYIYFGLGTTPPKGAKVLSAKFRLWSDRAWPENVSHVVNLLRIGVAWSAPRLTWNNRPQTFIAGTKGVTKSGVLPQSTMWEWDVTDWIQTIVSGGPNFGWQITTTEAIMRVFYSERHPSLGFRPELYLLWSDAPHVPTGLSPSGGSAVGVPRPTVSAKYVDVSGSTQLAAVQVQANDADVWTSGVDFDSGIVPTAVPELVLSATSFPVLVANQQIYWRIRFQDAAGEWSGWSAPTSFKYVPKLTLTVNNPPVGTPVVEDTTPIISWTVSGGVQAFYQVQLRHEHSWGGVVELLTVGKTAGAVNSLTVPAGKIAETGRTYSVQVKVWDAQQRQAVPESAAWTEVVRDFTYVPGSTAAPTGLTAVQVTNKPAVQLTWNRATMPDQFKVFRSVDGGPARDISGPLTPTDIFVSGTQYTWQDYTPHPQRTLTYSVRAVVNGISGPASTATPMTVRVNGEVWLREKITGLELVLTSRTDQELRIAEQVGVLRPIAPDAAVVLIKQSTGRLEGRVSGDLANHKGLTAQQWRDAFIKFVDQKIKRCWLTLGDSTFEVVVHDFDYKQRPIPVVVFVVSFTFYQQNRLTDLLGSS